MADKIIVFVPKDGMGSDFDKALDCIIFFDWSNS